MLYFHVKPLWSFHKSYHNDIVLTNYQQMELIVMTAIGKVIQNLAEQLIQALDADPCVLSFTQHLNSKCITRTKKLVLPLLLQKLQLS